MDGSRFDAIARTAAALTRRATLGALLTTALGWRSVAAEVEAEGCLPNGQRCGRKSGGRRKSCKKCCSKYAPKEKGSRHCACAPFGAKCGNSGQCCEGDCNHGRCGCLDDGETCTDDRDCCFSNCIDGICQCVDDGGACEEDFDCCFSDCVQGICQCIDDGGACEDDFDCCFSDCVQGFCQCLDDGATCSDDFECCNTFCVQGICQCFADGATCERDEDCCDTPCTGGVCAFATCEAGNEACTGGTDPESPFCNSFACLCLRSTADAPFCGEIDSATQGCTGCEVDADCDAITGAGSACVIAEDCCTAQGGEPSTLCLAPCPDAAARSQRADRGAEVRAKKVERKREYRKQAKKKRH